MPEPCTICGHLPKPYQEFRRMREGVCPNCYSYRQHYGIQELIDHMVRKKILCMCSTADATHPAKHPYTLRTPSPKSNTGHTVDKYRLCDACLADARALDNWVEPAPRPTTTFGYITPGRYTVRVR